MENKTQQLTIHQKLASTLLFASCIFCISWLTPGKESKNMSSSAVSPLFTHQANLIISKPLVKFYALEEKGKGPDSPLHVNFKIPLVVQDNIQMEDTLPHVNNLDNTSDSSTSITIKNNQANYNSISKITPGLKKQQEIMQESSQHMESYFHSPEWKNFQKSIQKSALSMQKYFKSEDWKKQQVKMETSAGESKKYFQSPEWKKIQKNIQKSAHSMQQYFNGPEWKKQQEQIQKSAQSMQKYFQSPEWKKRQEEIQKSALSFAQYFQGPEWKKQMEKIKQSSLDMQQFFKSNKNWNAPDNSDENKGKQNHQDNQILLKQDQDTTK